MNRAEKLLNEMVLSKIPKDSMILHLMTPEVNKNIIDAMEEIAYQAWREGFGDSYPDVFEIWFNGEIKT